MGCSDTSQTSHRHQGQPSRIGAAWPRRARDSLRGRRPLRYPGSRKTGRLDRPLDSRGVYRGQVRPSVRTGPGPDDRSRAQAGDHGPTGVGAGVPVPALAPRPGPLVGGVVQRELHPAGGRGGARGDAAGGADDASGCYRRPLPGLRADRQGEGSAGANGDHPPRHTQRPDAARERAGPDPGSTSVRALTRRGTLWHPGLRLSANVFISIRSGPRTGGTGRWSWPGSCWGPPRGRSAAWPPICCTGRWTRGSDTTARSRGAERPVERSRCDAPGPGLAARCGRGSLSTAARVRPSIRAAEAAPLLGMNGVSVGRGMSRRAPVPLSSTA